MSQKYGILNNMDYVTFSLKYVWIQVLLYILIIIIDIYDSR